MPFKSKAQVRWAFATHQKFAKKWAHQNQRKAGKKVWFKALPARKSARKR